MKKKNLLYLIVAIVLIVVSVFVILYENGVFKGSKKSNLSSRIFAIEDSSRVSKIFLADMTGNQVLLTRTPQGWLVNDSIPAMQEKVEGLLSILTNITVRGVVPKKAQANINTALAVGAIKTEIYEKAPKFTIFGIKFLEKERIAKTYYMGSATQDNVSNFASLVGYDEPYIVHVPGFRGFVTPQYSPIPYDWISHRVFETKLTRIQTLESRDMENPEESFTFVKAGPRYFDLYNHNGEKIMDYDTTRVLDMLSEYRNKNFEAIENQITPFEKDSVLRFNLFKILTLTDIEGNKTEVKFYRMKDYGEYYLDEFKDTDLEEEFYPWNRDRFYGVVNDDTSQLYKMQFFHFDRQLQPFSYFVTKGQNNMP